MDEGIGSHGQFRHERPDETAGGVLIIILLDGIIDPHRVDAGGTGLHLHLVYRPRQVAGAIGGGAPFCPAARCAVASRSSDAIKSACTK